ncbi:MAG: hypothetical protein WDZ59_14535 [Pirellulales bacterium]
MARQPSSVALLFASLAASIIPLASHEPARAVIPDFALASADPQLATLPDRLDGVLELYQGKMLNTQSHGPWEIMHAIIAYGVDTQIRIDGPSGEPVTAIGWLCFNRPAAGQRLLYTGRQGELAAMRGPGLQGHDGQFLAILAQSKVMPDYPIKVGERDFTVADLVEYEQKTCVAGTELTFKLIGLSHYLESDATWTSENGQQWSIERLIREEIAQPIRGATCGGTHRLMGLSYAIQRRVRQGLPITGEFRRAEIYTSDYHKYTFKQQNSDGSFSTAWFSGRGNDADLDTRLRTTGHILEWMAFSLPKDGLTDPRTVQAVEYLTGLLHDNSSRRWEIGPLGHALHALALYRDRALDRGGLDRPSRNLASYEAQRTAAKDDDAGETTPQNVKGSRGPVLILK